MFTIYQWFLLLLLNYLKPDKQRVRCLSGFTGNTFLDYLIIYERVRGCTCFFGGTNKVWSIYNDKRSVHYLKCKWPHNDFNYSYKFELTYFPIYLPQPKSHSNSKYTPCCSCATLIRGWSSKKLHRIAKSRSWASNRCVMPSGCRTSFWPTNDRPAFWARPRRTCWRLYRPMAPWSSRRASRQRWIAGWICRSSHSTNRLVPRSTKAVSISLNNSNFRYFLFLKLRSHILEYSSMLL